MMRGIASCHGCQGSAWAGESSARQYGCFGFGLCVAMKPPIIFSPVKKIYWDPAHSLRDCQDTLVVKNHNCTLGCFLNFKPVSYPKAFPVKHPSILPRVLGPHNRSFYICICLQSCDPPAAAAAPSLPCPGFAVGTTLKPPVCVGLVPAALHGCSDTASCSCRPDAMMDSGSDVLCACPEACPGGAASRA